MWAAAEPVDKEKLLFSLIIVRLPVNTASDFGHSVQELC